MSEVTKKVVFSFDPLTSGVMGLSNEMFRIIWSCIKTSHIVDQYFNQHVQSLVDLISEEMPEDYESFKIKMMSTGLVSYGTTNNDDQAFLHYGRTTDDEFWTGIFEYLNGSKTLEFEFPTSVSA